MSANTSQRKLHGAVMGATVDGFAGWRMGCDVPGLLPLSDPHR